MISVLQFVPLFLYSFWMMRRVLQARPPTASDPRPAGTLPDAGLEDDPVHWPATSAWTALDERQLIRLLKDSAP